MLDRVRQLLTGSLPRPSPVTNQRLVPDPKRVLAGFGFWMMSLRKPTGEVDVVQAEQKAFLAGLEAKGLRQTDAGIPIDSPFLTEVFQQFKKWQKEPHFKCTAILKFMLDPSAEPGWEWYRIFRWRDVPVDNQKFVCRADRMPSGMDWGHQEFVSERCKKVIEAAGLRGMEFTWIADLGRYRAPQWFHAMATEPLWSGMAQLSLGSPTVSGGRVHLGSPLADALVDVFPPSDVRLEVFEQYLREDVPDTDFAFTRFHLSRFTDIYCSARAREVLLQNNCLTKEDFVPVWIWDSLPKGAAKAPKPDNKSSLVAHPHNEAEWRAIQEQIAIRKAEFLANPKPACTTTFESVLERFRARTGDDSPDVSSWIKARITSPEAQSSMPPLPKLWETVLDASEDFYLYTGGCSEDEYVDSFEVVPRTQLVESQSEFREYAESVIPGFSSGLLHFAHNGCGDSLAFDLRTLTTEGDCRVQRCRHDPVGVDREWPSIVQLLEESLELAEKEEADGED